MFEHGDRKRAREDAVGEGESFGGAADPQGTVEHALAGCEPARSQEALHREVAADRLGARACRFDHRVPGASHSHVDDCVTIEQAGAAQARQVAPAPVRELVVRVRPELGIEVPPLCFVLAVAGKGPVVHEQQDAVDGAEAVTVHARHRTFVDGHRRGANGTPQGRFQHGSQPNGVSVRLMLSVVIPVHNEAAHLPRTIDALTVAVARSGYDAELVLVDDGSSDGSVGVARAAVAGRLPLRVISQPNRGRFEARQAGVAAATGDTVLLLDGRVRIHEGALAHVESRGGVWTAHVHVETRGNVYGEFWKLLAELAWDDYFANPRDARFGADDFDRYPKGTTCFIAPSAVLKDAIAAFRSAYADVRHANDDTPLIRWIAEREPVNISPSFACDYRPRMTLGSFLRHSFHRGVVFLDGHGRRESRFFPAVAAFYPASLVLALAAVRRPAVAAYALAATSAGAGILGVAYRRRAQETANLALLGPIYALAHGAGMWRGLALLTSSRPR